MQLLIGCYTEGHNNGIYSVDFDKNDQTFENLKI